MKRRSLIALGGSVVALGGLIVSRNSLTHAAMTRWRHSGVTISSDDAAASDMCRLTADQEEGPYFFSAPERRDIREDRPGLPLILAFRVVDAESCTPLEHALVEVWHCDAQGRYSGYAEDLTRKPFDTLLGVGLMQTDGHVEPENTKTYLRGAQRSNGEGWVEFTTIFPGWYDPRATHIHVKVQARDQTFVTTQLYFPTDLVNEIYASHPDYSPHGKTPYTHDNDFVLGMYNDANGLLVIPEGADQSMRVTKTFGV